MAAEGGEVLLQRLLIADISQHLGAPRQARTAAAGHKQAGAGHQHRQAHALKGHGFAAGVGAGDRHHPQPLMHPHAHRHHRTGALTALLPEQQWMAQPLELQRSQRIGLQLRPHCSQPGAVAGAGQGAVEHQKHLLQLLQRRLLRSHQSAELLQHGALGIPFLALKLAQAIAQRNHSLGLNEHRAAGSGAVVHEARQLARGASLHRQHRATIALGDHAVLQQGGVAAQHLVQAVAALLASRADLAAQLGQGRAGAIRYAATVFNAEAQALLQFRQGAHRFHQGRGDGAQLGIVDLAPQPPRGRQGGGHIKQIVGSSNTALGAQLQDAAEVSHPLKTETTFGDPIEGEQFGGLGQQLLAGLTIGAQGQITASLPPGGGAGEASHMLPQPPPLEQLQRLALNATERFTHAGNMAIGSAPVLEGMPPAGS